MLGFQDSSGTEQDFIRGSVALTGSFRRVQKGVGIVDERNASLSGNHESENCKGTLACPAPKVMTLPEWYDSHTTLIVGVGVTQLPSLLAGVPRN